MVGPLSAFRRASVCAAAPRASLVAVPVPQRPSLPEYYRHRRRTRTRQRAGRGRRLHLYLLSLDIPWLYHLKLRVRFCGALGYSLELAVP